MKQEVQTMQAEKRTGFSAGCGGASGVVFSRRVAVGTSGAALLGLLAGTTLGREQNGQSGAGTGGTLRERARTRSEDTKAFMERLRNASSIEERAKVVDEQREAERRRAVDDWKGRLGIPEAEWPVVRPRLEAVYDLVRPMPTGLGPNTAPRSEVERRSRELRTLLQDAGPAVDEIKAKVAALRSAKDKARQERLAAQERLRQIMTVRQEALLVLDGLLD